MTSKFDSENSHVRNAIGLTEGTAISETCFTCRHAGRVLTFPDGTTCQECLNPKFGSYWVMASPFGCSSHESRDNAAVIAPMPR